MKKSLLLTLLPLLPFVLNANEGLTNHDQVSQQIQEIKPPRKGVSDSVVRNISSPFVFLKEIKSKGGTKKTYSTRKTVKFEPLKMESAINKNVKINGKWYKEGDRVRGYTIVQVSAGEALLKSKKKELKLNLNQKNDKIQFKVN